MAEYRTEQKKILLDFLTENSENSYTIDEIIAELAKIGGAVPAQSTVYRLMTRLVEEKKVLRGTRGRQFVYRIIADEHCRNHLHLQCVGCGKIIHLDEKLSGSLLKKVEQAKDFSVSEEETVLLGRCRDCKEGCGE